MSSAVPNLLRILFVEDNDYVRETMELLLESPSREVVCCASGEAALAAFEACPFDVLITDVSLGVGMSGMDLARAVLRLDPQAWVVVSSGYSFDHGLAELGPHVRSMPKPIDFDQLDTLLDEVRHSKV